MSPPKIDYYLYANSKIKRQTAVKDGRYNLLARLINHIKINSL